MAKVLIKRGTAAQIESARAQGQLMAGELMLATDTGTLYAATGPSSMVNYFHYGNLPLASYEEAFTGAGSQPRAWTPDLIGIAGQGAFESSKGFYAVLNAANTFSSAQGFAGGFLTGYDSVSNASGTRTVVMDGKQKRFANVSGNLTIVPSLPSGAQAGECYVFITRANTSIQVNWQNCIHFGDTSLSSVANKWTVYLLVGESAFNETYLFRVGVQN